MEVMSAVEVICKCRYYAVIWPLFTSPFAFLALPETSHSDDIKQPWFPVVLLLHTKKFYSFYSRSIKWPLCLSSSSTCRTSSPPTSLLCLPLLSLSWSGLDACTLPNILKFLIYIFSFLIRIKVPQERYCVVSMSIALLPSKGLGT